MGLFDSLGGAISGFSQFAGGIADDLGPVADLYGSITGSGPPTLDLGTFPSLGGGGIGSPGIVADGTSIGGGGSFGPPTAAADRTNMLVVVGVGLLALYLLTKR